MKNASNTQCTANAFETQCSNCRVITVLKSDTESSQQRCPCQLNRNNVSYHPHTDASGIKAQWLWHLSNKIYQHSINTSCHYRQSCLCITAATYGTTGQLPCHHINITACLQVAAEILLFRHSLDCNILTAVWNFHLCFCIVKLSAL